MKLVAYSKLAAALSVTSVLLLSIESEGFASHAPYVGRNLVVGRSAATTESEVPVEAITKQSNESDIETDQPQSVRAPLKFMGPQCTYPALGLKFPNLATKAQRSKNMTGISLDFVMDTAANTNTINGQVAQELGLEVVGESLPGVSAGGAMTAGTTFMVGDCELEGLPKEEQFTFMQGLTASALPVASPAAAGLLSLPFFYSFEGGVEFQWGNPKNEGEETLPPSVTFYGEGESDAALKEMTKVPVRELPVTRLPSVDIVINGVTIPALLDTGSPITVINAQAAEQAGVATVDFPGKANQKAGGNPFSKFANRFQEAKEMQQAAARGDVLSIAGSTGQRVDLLKSAEMVQVDLKAADDEDDKTVVFGDSNIYVGNLPGLAALNALGDNSPPAAVLGMDVLRMRPKMLLKARDNEVFF